MKKLLITITLLLSIIANKLVAQDLDPTFGSGGMVVRPEQSVIKSIATQGDQKILTAGFEMENYHFEIARHHANGTLDSTFGNNGIVNTIISFRSQAKKIIVQPDGKIVVGGTYYTGDFVNIYHIALVRYHSNGTPDSSFGNNGIVMQEVDFSVEMNDMKMQPDGKIVVGGTVIPLSSIAVEHFLVARFNKDGSLDNSFGSGGLVRTTNGIHTAIAEIELQPDGKIIAAGRKGQPSLIDPVDDVQFQLVRYNTNGSIDLSFGNEGFVTTDVLTGNPDMISSTALQSNGKIVAAGCWDDSLTIVRYNTNGTIDSTFGVHGKSISQGYPASLSLAVAGDDRLLVASSILYDIEDAGDFALTKFLADGSIDTDFGSGGKVVTDVNSGSTDYASTIHIQPDGKILLGGSSDDFASMVRYMGDGTTSTGKLKQSELTISCHPNPFIDHVFLKINGINHSTIVTARLSNLSGQILLNKKLTLNQAGSKLLLPNLNTGSYILNISDNEGKTWSSKIVKIQG